MITDVQDILEVGAPGQQDAQVTKESLMGEPKKKSKKMEQSVKKPEGMHREVYNLLISDKELTPLVPAVPLKIGGYKNVKAKLGLRKVRPWQWSRFTNPSRKDDLKLCHWRRVEDEDKEYPFSRFNKVLEIKKPSVENLDMCKLSDDKWSQESIEHLFELCKRFDLRWPVIHDRYDYEKFGKKSIEDMKEKFYNVSNAIAQANIPAGQEPRLLYFDAAHERIRKEQLEKLWNRTEKQIEEEEFLVEELQRIESRKKERARKAKDLQKLISAVDRSPAAPGLVSGAGVGVGGTPTGVAASTMPLQKKKFYKGPSASAVSVESLNVESGANLRFPEYKASGVHLRSQRMKMQSTLGLKKLKAVDVALNKLGLEHHPMATEDIVVRFNDLRSDILLLYELKCALSSCEFELETLKHHFHSLTDQELHIPLHLRVVQDDVEPENSSPFKRRISDALEVPSGPVIIQNRKKKSSISCESTSLIRKMKKL